MRNVRAFCAALVRAWRSAPHVSHTPPHHVLNADEADKLGLPEDR